MKTDTPKSTLVYLSACYFCLFCNSPSRRVVLLAARMFSAQKTIRKSNCHNCSQSRFPNQIGRLQIFKPCVTCHSHTSDGVLLYSVRSLSSRKFLQQAGQLIVTDSLPMVVTKKQPDMIIDSFNRALSTDMQDSSRKLTCLHNRSTGKLSHSARLERCPPALAALTQPRPCPPKPTPISIKSDPGLMPILPGLADF